LILLSNLTMPLTYTNRRREAHSTVVKLVGVEYGVD